MFPPGSESSACPPRLDKPSSLVRLPPAPACGLRGSPRSLALPSSLAVQLQPKPSPASLPAAPSDRINLLHLSVFHQRQLAVFEAHHDHSHCRLRWLCSFNRSRLLLRCLLPHPIG